MRTVTQILVGLAITAVAFIWLHPDVAIVDRLGFGGDGMSRLTKVSVGFVTLLVGAFSGSAFRHLIAMRSKGRKTITNFRKFLADVARGIDLWIGVFGSVLVFSANLRGLEGVTVETYIYMAFEKGFLLTILAEQIYNSLVSAAVRKSNANGPEGSNTD